MSSFNQVEGVKRLEGVQWGLSALGMDSVRELGLGWFCRIKIGASGGAW